MSDNKKVPFILGDALAANQCEGAWQEDGRGPSIVDILPAGKNAGRRWRIWSMPGRPTTATIRPVSPSTFITDTKRI